MATFTKDAPVHIDAQLIANFQRVASVQRRRAGVAGTDSVTLASAAAAAAAARSEFSRHDQLQPVAATRRVAMLAGTVARRPERNDARPTVSAPLAVSDVVDPIDARLTVSDATTGVGIAQTVARYWRIVRDWIALDDHQLQRLRENSAS